MTEEIVFRACVLSIYHLSGASRQYMIYFAPLTFGLGQLFAPFSLSLSFLTVLFYAQHTFIMHGILIIDMGVHG